jgi:hypothetical protein
MTRLVAENCINEMLVDSESTDKSSDYVFREAKIFTRYILMQGIDGADIILQNDVLKNDGALYDHVARIMGKHMLGDYSQKEFELQTLAYFTIGVDAALMENKYIYN